MAELSPLHSAENERPESLVVQWQPPESVADQSAQAVGQPDFTSSGETWSESLTHWSIASIRSGGLRAIAAGASPRAVQMSPPVITTVSPGRPTSRLM